MKITEMAMKRTTEERAPDASGDEVVLMYPDNQLKEQVREFGEGLTAFKVLKDAFFAEIPKSP